MVSPSVRLSINSAPFTSILRFPLYLANNMENEVSKTLSGTIFATVGKAWLSVITRAGGFPSFFSVSSSSVSRTVTETAPASKRSRMVCCCGRISLPFGAALSIGTTSTTKSIGETRSRTICRFDSSEGTRRAMRSLSS